MRSDGEASTEMAARIRETRDSEVEGSDAAVLADPARNLWSQLDFGRPLAYSVWMEFEWDDAKNDACFLRRGLDFVYAVRAFHDPNRIVTHDRRRDYGEDRYRLLGTIDGRVYVVVYTVRGSAIRIISARKANGREVTYYEYNTRQN